MKRDGITNFYSNTPVGAQVYYLKELGRMAAERAEKEAIRNVLQETHWNRKEAAKLLHISYKALLYEIKKYFLDDRIGIRNNVHQNLGEMRSDGK